MRVFNEFSIYSNIICKKIKMNFPVQSDFQRFCVHQPLRNFFPKCQSGSKDRIMHFYRRFRTFLNQPLIIFIRHTSICNVYFTKNGPKKVYNMTHLSLSQGWLSFMSPAFYVRYCFRMQLDFGMFLSENVELIFVWLSGLEGIGDQIWPCHKIGQGQPWGTFQQTW